MIIKKVLIGIDNSIYAEHAAAYGFDIARKFDAAVGIVNIMENVLLPSAMSTNDPIMGMNVPTSGIEDAVLLDLQKNQSQNLVDQISKKYAGDLTVTLFNEYGPTADGIIDCGRTFEADIIIVGTHHRSSLERLLSGSVAEHVIRHSDVPVLVVPLKEDNH